VTITRREQLAALPQPYPAVRPVKVPQTPYQFPPEIWFIPPPADGVTYTIDEIASMLGYKPSAVKDLIARGRLVDGEQVRLHTLRIPRGRIAPNELCSFLSSINGIRVEVAHVK